MSLDAVPLKKRFRVVGIRPGGLLPQRLMEICAYAVLRSIQ